MKKTIKETIDGSIKNIIQLKTVDNSLEYSQLFDALEDCDEVLKSKLIETLNSLSQTKGVPPTEIFNRVLCKSGEDNDNVKKKMYNWWRAVFDVLSKCEIPKDKVEEYKGKVDNLMAEILKAGDKTEPNEELVSEEGYEHASIKDEEGMLNDMKFAIG